jgi:hypothetical protein
MKTINKFTLQYAEKTSQHLFARKVADKVVEYMKVEIVNIDGEKALMIITLDADFKVKNIHVDTGRFINYIENAREGSLKHEADVYLRSQIFGHEKGQYYSVPKTFKIKDGLGRTIQVNLYILEIKERFLNKNYFENKKQEILEKKKSGGWVTGLLHLPGQPDEAKHFRVYFTNSMVPEDSPVNQINSFYNQV